MHHVMGCHGLSLNDGMGDSGWAREGGVGNLDVWAYLGCMTVCAIIEHPRCRSRPNDQMKLRKVLMYLLLGYVLRGAASDKVRAWRSYTTTVIARQLHRSTNPSKVPASPCQYSLQQGISPNEGKTNELLLHQHCFRSKHGHVSG